VPGYAGTDEIAFRQPSDDVGGPAYPACGGKMRGAGSRVSCSKSQLSLKTLRQGHMIVLRIPRRTSSSPPST